MSRPKHNHGVTACGPPCPANPYHEQYIAGPSPEAVAYEEFAAAQGFSTPHTGKTVAKWADQAMFTAEPIDTDKGPQVHLLWMTPDPLAAIAGPALMYQGKTVRSLRDVTNAERQELYAQVLNTKLQMPFEAVKFHFVVEGVTRAFANQMVRQRTAAYAQRSDRFAVQEGEHLPVALPPSLAGTQAVWRQHEAAALSVYPTQDAGDADVERFVANSMIRESDAERQRWTWDKTVEHVHASQQNLVVQGMPQEDVRGLLPINLLTTIHYITDLRALLDHGGNRLCTQAQFEWKLVFSRIKQAIRNYDPYVGLRQQLCDSGEVSAAEDVAFVAGNDAWQYEAIADMFKPVCYLTGKCEFKANFDRKCNIRERVDANAAINRPSSEWHEEKVLMGHVGDHGEYLETGRISPIFPAEWLLNPGAAR
jgi:thymidylate synthase ThyX